VSVSANASALLRRALPYLTVVLVVAVAYDGSIFYGRWRYARDAQKAQAINEVQDARRVVDALGGDRLKILNFYATPPTVRSGQKSMICYGVNAAESVRLDPPVEQLHPAVSHCFQVAPRRATEYKLIVADRAGHTLTQSLAIQVTQQP
jgi:hypothetical protein